MENRNGLIVDLRLVEANGCAERETALAMLEDHVRPGATVGGDKGYDVESFVEGCRELGVAPHIAQTSDKRRSSAVDGRTTRHPGYEISQRKRKLVEEIFGWMKTVGAFRRSRFKGKARSAFAALIVASAYNLLRVAKLTAQPA